MNPIRISQTNPDTFVNSPVVLNLGQQDQYIKIYSSQNIHLYTEISYNPEFQEINIRFYQTSTLIANAEINTVIQEQESQSFWDLYELYIENKKSEYSNGFIKQIVSTRNLIKRFMKNNELTFNEIDIPFFERLRDYYIKDLGNSYNSFAGNVKRMKFFLKYALKCGWTTNDKFKQFKATERYGKVVYLHWDELMKLYRMDFKKSKLNQVRDCFVFQSMIGCRYQDLKNLMKKNYSKSILRFMTQKTKTQIEIPLTGIAKEIIDNNSCLNKKTLLPVMTLYSYNKNLKLVGKMAGLDRIIDLVDQNGINYNSSISKIMSSHMARKNFIGNAVLST
jgi:site-specific recombinase XerD